MPKRTIEWTDEQVAIVKRMWAENATLTEIADAIPGATRSAVSGKVRRLGLAYKTSEETRAINKRAGLVREAEKRAVRKKTEPPIKPEPPPPPPTAARISFAPTGGKVLTDLKPSDCRWPIGDPQRLDFRFCGAERLFDGPYCEGHAAVAFNQRTR